MDEFEVLTQSIAEMRTEVKEMRGDVNKLVAIEERVASVLRQSEQNASQIGRMFEGLEAQSSRIAALNTIIAVNGALDNYNGKLVWAIATGVAAIVSSIIASNFI